MRGISEKAQTKYQDLIFRDRRLSYVLHMNPHRLPEIGELNIGSRPSKRKNSDRFEDLSAIPWVFAWTQSRYFYQPGMRQERLAKLLLKAKSNLCVCSKNV